MNLEFFTGSDGHVWFRDINGCQRLSTKNVELLDYMMDRIYRVFPGTYKRLQSMYKESECNKYYFKFRCVERFIRCNMGDDNAQKLDVTDNLFNLEVVQCPLRGICKDEGVLCKPSPDSAFSPAEKKVAELYSEGCTINEIAHQQQKSVSTVNNQLWNICKKFGVSTRREIVNLCRNFNLV